MPRGRVKEPLIDRITSKTGYGEPDECWLWKGVAGSRGYVLVKIDGRSTGAHRAVYQLLVGPIPEGFVIDHLCHNRDESCVGGSSCVHRRCVNPSHLEAVSQQENILRGKGLAAREARQSHCKRGHIFDEANTGPSSSGGRYCIACNRDRASRTYDKYRKGVRTHA